MIYCLWNITNMYQDLFHYHWAGHTQHFKSRLLCCQLKTLVCSDNGKVLVCISDVSHVTPLSKHCTLHIAFLVWLWWWHESFKIRILYLVRPSVIHLTCLLQWLCVRVIQCLSLNY